MEKVEQDFVILPGGVHLWNPSPAFLGEIPDDVIAEQSSGYPIDELPSPNWRKITTPYAIIEGDVSDEAFRVLGVTADEIIKMLMIEMGGPSQNRKYRVRVFADRPDFCSFAKACGSATALSLYNPRTSELAVHFGDTMDARDFEQTYAHELTHAYMDYTFRVTEPLWFAEGMAVFFSDLAWTSHGFIPTRKNPTGIIHLAKEIMPLKRLLQADKNDLYGSPEFYENAWAFTKFLIRQQPIVVESLLNRSRLDLAYLEPKYRAYIKRSLRG